MPFPSVPRDQQITNVNGITYQYNAAKTAWVRYKSTTANTIVSDFANIRSNTSSTSTATGALVVAGGAGIQGNLFANSVYTNNYFYSNGTAFAGGSVGFTGSTGAGFTGSAGTAGFTGSAGTQGPPGIATSSLAVDNFTGDGTTTDFSLSVTPTGINQTLIIIDGVGQLRSAYTLSGSTVQFTEAPASGAKIEVTTFVYGTASFVARNYTANGTGNTYTVTSGVTAESIIVTQNGIIQRPTVDYTVSGSTLTLATTPTGNTVISIREIPATSVGFTGSGSGSSGANGFTGSQGYTGSAGASTIYSRYAVTATANQTSFAVAYVVGYLQVYFNGALLNDTDYTASNGSTVVLVDPAAAGDLVEFVAYNAVPVGSITNATLNSTNITANLSITAGYSAVSVGPISIANGVTISIADGQKWVIL